LCQQLKCRHLYLYKQTSTENTYRCNKVINADYTDFYVTNGHFNYLSNAFENDHIEKDAPMFDKQCINSNKIRLLYK